MSLFNALQFTSTINDNNLSQFQVTIHYKSIYSFNYIQSDFLVN